MTDTPHNDPNEQPGNEANGAQDEGFHVNDKRRVNPETGEVRDPLDEVEDILNNADTEGMDDAAADAEATEQPAESSAEAEELRSDLQRLQADYINYRRRVERDRDVAKNNAVFSMLEDLLPVLDDIDAAKQAGDLEEGPFASIAKKLESALANRGLVRQDQEALVGTEFDPKHHEAMLRQPNAEIPEEHIVQVFRNGYLYGDRVVRAAQVMVSAGEE